MCMQISVCTGRRKSGKTAGEEAGTHMNQPRACENQAQIKNNFRSSSETVRDAAQNHLGRRFPGADVKHVDGASGMEQAVQKLRDSCQQEKKKGRRQKAFQRFPEGKGSRLCQEFRLYRRFVRRRFVHRRFGGAA